jgi:hypothetical protein
MEVTKSYVNDQNSETEIDENIKTIVGKYFSLGSCKVNSENIKTGYFFFRCIRKIPQLTKLYGTTKIIGSKAIWNIGCSVRVSTKNILSSEV